MDFESPDVAKDFPGLYASDSTKKNISHDSDYSDEEKLSRKDLLGKRKEKKESKKDKGYVAFEGESSEDEVDETKSPGKIKKNRSTFAFPRKEKKERKEKSKEKDVKEKKDDEKDKFYKKEVKEKKESKEVKSKKKEEKKKKEKKSKKKKSSERFSEENPIFGVPLSEAVERSKSHDGIEIPVIVRECIDYIEEHGLSCEGIYRISGVKSKVHLLKSQYNRHEKVYLYEHEPHVVASLLKQFLRELPEPILTAELVPKFEEAAAMKNESKKVETLLKLLECLPNCNRSLLSWMFVHMLHVVQLEKRNKMNLQNTSIVLSSTMQISHPVLYAFFTHSHEVFKGIEIKKYVPPTEPDNSRLSLELPDSPTALKDELSRQEGLLNMIHEELNTGVRDIEKEEKLWEVQRVVTQLKRKLRFLRQVMQNSKQQEKDLNEQKQQTSNDTIEITHDEKTDVEGNESVCDKSTESNNVLSIETVAHDLDTASVSKNEETPIRHEESEEETIIKENKNTECFVPEELETLPESDVLYMNEHDISEEDTQKTAEAVQTTCDINMESTETEEKLLKQEKMMLMVQEEELLLLADELKRKISSEKMEIDKLRQEIAEYQQFFKYRVFSLDSTENSSTDSDDSSPSDEDEIGDLVNALRDLFGKNELLKDLNHELSQNIQHEREACLELKVRMKMAQKDNRYMQL